MAYLLFTSICSLVLQNSLFKAFSKNNSNGDSAVNSFNLTIYLLCAVSFGIILLTGSMSVYSAALGLFFGIFTALSYHYKILALSKGPMHLTLLLTTSSMMIPTMSGVFFGEKFSFVKLIIVFLLIFFIYLSFEKNNRTKIGGKWFLYCLISFFALGAVGVLQKTHQTSAHKGESSGFLFVAFFFAAIWCLLKSKGKIDKVFLQRKTNLIMALFCGGCTFAMNYINLKLSGMLPSQLFFPLVNGSGIVFSSLLSVFLFKEKLTARQTIGLVGGIVSLVAICLVP